MKSLHPKTVLVSLILLTGTACSKSEGSTTDVMHETDSAVLVSDSISTAATMEVEGKRFIKSANVDMEVKDVYDATIAIEKSVQEMGGFVTSSELHSSIVSEETYEVSNENAVLVRKFRTENNMQVRVPTEQLGALLQFINNRKVFLTSRVIWAEDVSANIELAKMESERITTTANNIRQIQNDKDKVKLDDRNMAANNTQKVADLRMSDRLKYSTVQIYLKEPELRVAEIAVLICGTRIINSIPTSCTKQRTLLRKVFTLPKDWLSDCLRSGQFLFWAVCSSIFSGERGQPPVCTRDCRASKFKAVREYYLEASVMCRSLSVCLSCNFP